MAFKEGKIECTLPDDMSSTMEPSEHALSALGGALEDGGASNEGKDQNQKDDVNMEGSSAQGTTTALQLLESPTEKLFDTVVDILRGALQ